MTVDQSIELISKIDATPFGHTIFETIFVHMESGDPLDTLMETLANLEDQYVAEQKEDDATNRSYQDSCNQDLSQFDQEIAEAETYRVQLEAKLEGQLYPQRSILTGIVNSKTKEVKGIQKDIDDLEAQRAEEKEEFEASVADHNEATEIITQARRLFEGAASAFIQSKAKTPIDLKALSFVQKHLKEGVKKTHKFSHRKSYGSLIKILATITSSAKTFTETQDVERVITLIDNLLVKIGESLDLERSAEDKRVAAFNKARKLLTITLQNANTVLANLTVELNSVNDAIERNETAHENTTQRLQNLKTNRGDRHNECEEAAVEYAARRTTRDDQRATVSAAVGIVNSQLRTLREQLALRLAAGDNI
jgi:molybdopterin converting factor small subunit